MLEVEPGSRAAAPKGSMTYFKAGILALRQGIKTQDWDLGLEAWIWAWRLGGWGMRRRRRRKSPICVKA